MPIVFFACKTKRPGNSLRVSAAAESKELLHHLWGFKNLPAVQKANFSSRLML